MRKILFLAVLVSTMLLGLVACGSESSNNVAPDANAASSGSTVYAAEFSLPVVRKIDGDIRSSTFSLAANRGKSTVLYFSFAG